MLLHQLDLMWGEKKKLFQVTSTAGFKHVLIHRLGNSLCTLILLCFILPCRGAGKGVCEDRSSRQQAFTAGLHKDNSKPALIWLYEEQCEDDTGNY